MQTLSQRPRKIAVIGAGPIGLEAALCAATLGHDVRVFECGSLGHHLRRWGFVRMFSPWRLGRSGLGMRALTDMGWPLDPGDEYPSGADYLERYLEPLSRHPRLAGRIFEGHRIVGIARPSIGKAYFIGPAREEHGFRLLVESSHGEKIVHADIVLDCSGTFGTPNWMGNGGIPAEGERALRERFSYTVESLGPLARNRYEGQRVLVVGCGHSAATALEALLGLERTSILWCVRREGAFPEVAPNDPLPERSRLSQLLNDLAGGGNSRVDYRGGTGIERVARHDEGFEVTLSGGNRDETVLVEEVVALVGSSPDNSLYRELQVQECHASLGPMDLAASLLGPGSADCLTEPTGSAETLRTTEPGFFVLGSKSYGKNSAFLLRSGIAQVQDAFRIIEGRRELVLDGRSSGG